MNVRDRIVYAVQRYFVFPSLLTTEERATACRGLREAIDALEAEAPRLRKAIETHRSQKADDRCVEDDDRLYEALDDGVKCDRRVGDKAAMLKNCARFIDRRCEGGGWPTYAELEAKVASLEKQIADAEEERYHDGIERDLLS